MKRLLLISLLSFTVSIFAFDFAMEVPGATAGDIKELEAGSFAIRSGFNYKDGLDLLPVNFDLKDKFMADIADYDPELSVEMLYLFDKPAVEDDQLLLYLLNNLKAFSEQVGIEYFSRRKQAMSLLVEECYFTDGKNEISDPVVSTVVPYLEETYYQKDTTFGGNDYTLKTWAGKNSIWIQNENLKDLYVYNFFKALKKGGVRSNYIVYTVDDKVLVYAIAQIREEPSIKKILTYDVNIPYSFQRRNNSIVLWYKDRLNK